MSDRTAVPLDQVAEQKFRDIDDRLRTLETRGVPGNVALSTATVADLSVAASATTPLRLNGSQAWTQAVEYLGESGPRVYGTTGGDALVTRDENALIMDIAPAPFVQYAIGAVQSIATTTIVPIVWTGAGPFSHPYGQAKTMASNGVIVVPVAGIYSFMSYGAWPNVVGTKGRVVIFQISSDGGVSWSTLFADGRSGINTASLGQDVTVMGRTAMLAGWRVRIAVIQDEVGALNYTPNRFSLQWDAGYAGS